MNAQDQSSFPPAPEPIPDETFEESHRGSVVVWTRRLLACNPFFLISAALLLYGFDRVSADSRFWPTELAQLVFNFTSLQFYELLLVATAIVLARRRVWYDSTLLAGLETLFVFVPFILITQGALIEQHYLWTMCGAGGVLAVLRWGALKRWHPRLNLPLPVLGIGLLLLGLNVVLPIVYRSVHESNRFGSDPDFGLQFELARYTWLLILPAAVVLGNFLPHAKEGEVLLPQRRWHPMVCFGLWVAATAVHIYALDYVYTLHVPRAWLAPALWTFAWSVRFTLPRLLASPLPAVKNIFALAAALVPVLAFSESGGPIFRSLTTLNAVIFGGICLAQREDHLAPRLLCGSVAVLIAGLPWESMRGLPRGGAILLGIVSYVFLRAVLSPHPKWSIPGMLASGAAVMILFGDRTDAIHWALQIGLVFLLLHSLRWVDEEYRGAAVLRGLGGLAWVIHALVWMHATDQWWAACVSGMVVMAAYLVTRFFRNGQRLIILPVAAVLVGLSGPANSGFSAVQSAPAGLLAVIGSFVLFAVGTVAAWTRHRWHPGGQSE